jgi:hypothetical protein
MAVKPWSAAEPHDPLTQPGAGALLWDGNPHGSYRQSQRRWSTAVRASAPHPSQRTWSAPNLPSRSV